MTNDITYEIMLERISMWKKEALKYKELFENIILENGPKDYWIKRVKDLEEQLKNEAK